MTTGPKQQKQEFGLCLLTKKYCPISHQNTNGTAKRVIAPSCEASRLPFSQNLTELWRWPTFADLPCRFRRLSSGSGGLCRKKVLVHEPTAATVIITGTSSGIGRSVAAHLAALGY